jgi:protocatechuate 3,4-dioxygenase beta subunit
MRPSSLAIATIALVMFASVARGQGFGVVGSVIGSLPEEPQRSAGPARDRRPDDTQPSGTASISGRVMAVEGSPLRRTQVQLSGPGVRGRTALTDGDGRYSFTGLPAGRYSLRTFRTGYINLAYGQRAPNEPGKPVELADGQSLSGIDFVLPRGSVVTGRVVDEFGDPVLQAQVQVLRYQYQPSGERALQPGGNTATTDDLGQFRIYGLNPGEYVVSATSRNQFLPMARFDSDLLAFGGQPQEGYAPTYYPGTANPAEAQSVTLGVGQELSVQLQLVPARLSEVSGSVFDSEGKPVNGSPVMLRPAANVFGGASRSAATTQDGSFTIRNVAPGDYFIEVRPRPRPGGGGRGAARQESSGTETEYASMPISVDGDITGLRIVTGQGATISGRVVFEGTPPAGNVRVRVVAQPASSYSIALPGTAREADGMVGADGSFELSRITGPIFLRVTLTSADGGPPPTQTINFMTKSVIVDGVDVADTPFDPTRRGRATNVTLVLTDKVTDIGGVVTDGRGTPLEGAAVLVVPESLPPGVSPARFQRIFRSDRDGKFSVRGMPPGRYVAVAINSIDSSHQYDPEIAQRVRQRGHSFSVREGDTVRLDLNLTTDF